MMTPRKQCIYNVEWQLLRVSLLGKWNSFSGAQENCGKITEYLNATSKPDYTRYWRALNALNGVIMGYNGQASLRNSGTHQHVAAFRNSVSVVYFNLKIGRPNPPEFAVDTKQQIISDWQKLNDWQRAAIFTDLEKRLKAHSTSRHRQELRWFLDIVKGR